MSGSAPEHYGSLDAIRTEAFRMLADGAADRRAAFHTPGLSTVGRDGAPVCRTVVLRHFDAATRMLTIHTDRRSAKVAQLIREPRCALLFYDTGAKIQVRISGTAVLHRGDEPAHERWTAMAAHSRRCYRAPTAPGSATSGPTDGFSEGVPLDEAAAFGNFACIRIAVESLEWLYLAAAGHRRARLEWRAGTERATWLAP